MTMTTLGRALGRLFAAPRPRPADPHRRQREKAKALASEHAIEIEHLHGGGFNVWPPRSFTGDDPFEGDHYCSDWDEVLTMVQRYAAPPASRPRP